VILNGHQHIYERFALQDPAGAATPEGIREFIVGTGGASTSAQPTVLSPNSQVRHGGTKQWGVLKLLLQEDSYSWEYLPVGNNTFGDRGSTACHGAIDPNAGTLAVSAGNGQSAAAGTAVAVPPSVKVTDAGGAPVAGVPVTFSVQAGGGSVSDPADLGVTGPSTVAITDADGIARVGGWTLGTVAGSNALNAHATGLNGSPLIFTATGTAGAVSGAASTATVPNGRGGNTTTITVQARDAYGNKVTTGGATVGVTVTGANTATATVTDNANGTYTAKYTPKKVGTDNVTVTVNGTATSGSPYPSVIVPKVVVNSGNNQSAPAGTAVPIPPSVKTVDGFGAAVPGASITFTIASGGGTVSPTAPVITNSSGIAAVTAWQLGPTPGTNTLQATVTGKTSNAIITATAQ
jgi:adhesin/invasin